MLKSINIKNMISLDFFNSRKDYSLKINKFFKLFFIRIELSNLKKKKNLNLEYKKILSNIFLIFFSNISSIKKLKTLNIIFNFLVFNYKGIRHLHSLPVNGQRTWSNKKTARICNNTLNLFLQQK